MDDEESVCKAIKMMLEFDGHTVQTADGGENALALIKNDNFDLVITDYSMGNMKGDRMAAQIRQDHPKLPIIMITAFADDFRESGKPTLDVDAVVNKPFSLKELRETIAQVIG